MNNYKIQFESEFIFFTKGAFCIIPSQKRCHYQSSTGCVILFFEIPSYFFDQAQQWIIENTVTISPDFITKLKEAALDAVIDFRTFVYTRHQIIDSIEKGEIGTKDEHMQQLLYSYCYAELDAATTT